MGVGRTQQPHGGRLGSAERPSHQPGGRLGSASAPHTKRRDGSMVERIAGGSARLGERPPLQRRACISMTSWGATKASIKQAINKKQHDLKGELQRVNNSLDEAAAQQGESGRVAPQRHERTADRRAHRRSVRAGRRCTSGRVGSSWAPANGNGPARKLRFRELRRSDRGAVNCRRCVLKRGIQPYRFGAPWELGLSRTRSALIRSNGFG